MITEFRIFEGYDNDYKVGDYVIYNGNFNIYFIVKIVDIDEYNKYQVYAISVSSPMIEMFYTWIGKFMIKGRASEEDIAEFKRIEDEVALRDAVNKYNI